MYIEHTCVHDSPCGHQVMLDSRTTVQPVYHAVPTCTRAVGTRSCNNRGPDVVAAAERSHRLIVLRAARPRSDGTFSVSADDLMHNFEVLKPVLSSLGGLQPTASMYASAVFQFDKASKCMLSGDNPKTIDENVVTAWSIATGQELHDAVAYCHKLARQTKTARDPRVDALKKLCPGGPCTRKRKTPDLDDVADHCLTHRSCVYMCEHGVTYVFTCKPPSVCTTTTSVSHGRSRYLTVCHGISRYLTVCHGISRYLTVS
jgi:hypothetical protein